LRRLVDQKLDLPLADWVDQRVQAGQSVSDVWADLRQTTGVPLSLRTLYVWLENEKQAS
jgi:hypothetical protein